ncbi:MAG: DEAD/DEAH box helicase family protein [Chloroflexi bacterium]|nr:DEAD/DEAH box helicase family protein [Chloroflexota bacterium]MCI0822627.1 DEAD/DEAH box helicase family protein [Chloroflexota bacterium]
MAKAVKPRESGGEGDDDESLGRYAGGALKFVKEVLGEKPYSKQEEILRAVSRNRRVSVVGCNGSGKDWAAARAVLWWVHSRRPAKAIVTGPTSRQVDDIVWNEVRYAYGKAAARLGGQMASRSSRYMIDDQTFALGFTSDSPFNFQGFHSPNLLVAVTEAHAVGQHIMDALRRLNPSRFLMTGNPFVAAGEFYDSHHTRRHLYRTVQISAFETPNIRAGKVVVPGMITQQDIDDRKEDWGEDSALYIGGIKGEFPDNLDNVVVPLWAATAATERELEPEGPVIVACDVARFGHDSTVVVRREGAVCSIVTKMHGHDLMQVAGYLMRYCTDNHVDALVVDDTGVGAGVVDRLREQGLPNARLVAFIAGQRALDDRHFVNRIAEVWWEMRRHYMSGEISTDNDPALVGQVSGREYSYESDGRIRLQSKENMHRSPDEADALAMTFAVTRGGGVKIWV